MSIATLIFYLFCLIIIASAAYIVITKNILHAAISLLSVLLSIAAIYVFAGADFLAIAHIMIYIGGVIILILFGIMLTIRGDEAAIITQNRGVFVGVCTGGAVLFGLVSLVLRLNLTNTHSSSKSIITGGSVEILGKGFMTTYLLPFEIAAILLLLALIGAAFIAKKSSEDIKL